MYCLRFFPSLLLVAGFGLSNLVLADAPADRDWSSLSCSANAKSEASAFSQHWTARVAAAEAFVRRCDGSSGGGSGIDDPQLEELRDLESQLGDLVALGQEKGVESLATIKATIGPSEEVSAMIAKVRRVARNSTRPGYDLCVEKNPSYNCSTTGSIGYGICTLYHAPYNCSTTADIGYGLCTMKNAPYSCSATATIGYGLCAQTNAPYNCSATGSLGYGICSQTNASYNCSTTGDIGYGVCAAKNAPYSCSASGSLGYGVCSLTNAAYNCSVTGTVGYGVCGHKNPSYSCSASGSWSYGVCALSSPPYTCAN